MSLEELSNPDVPGAGVRLALLKKGAAHENARLINYLVQKGILRESMFGDSLVARMAETPEHGTWPIIDLPYDLGFSAEKERTNA